MRTTIQRLFSASLSRTRPFTVLAIETSADDTGAAILTSNRDILSNVVVKQNALHEQWGGIHPYVAVQAHQANLPGAIRRALDEANMQVADVDGIAYTRGPGMTGCLGIGAASAKALSSALSKPLVGVHHMQAHALTASLTSAPHQRPVFPYLTLLISGGHTMLLLSHSTTSFRILATTPDESIGRVFDKVSRMLKLPWSTYGPGAALEDFCLSGPSEPTEDHSARDGDEDGAGAEIPQLSVPAPNRLMFSYSGLHSAVERFITSKGGADHIDESTKRALARRFQKVAFDQIVEKVLLGLKRCHKAGIEVGHLVVSGGVASNRNIRERLLDVTKRSAEWRGEMNPMQLVFPPPHLCTDNAVMIGWASMDRFLAGDYDTDYSLPIQSKWSLEDLSNEPLPPFWDEELAIADQGSKASAAEVD